MKELIHELKNLNVLAQIQIMGATIDALISSHPEPKRLRAELERIYSAMLADTTTQLIGEGLPPHPYLDMLQKFVDEYLAQVPKD